MTLPKIIVVAVVLALISLIDIWVDRNGYLWLGTLMSSLQTIALTLLVFTLYTYYKG